MQKKYLVDSSKKDKQYIVTMSIDPQTGAGGVTNCTCTGWKYRHRCHHADEVNADPSKFKLYKEGSVTTKKPLVEGATGRFRKPMLASTIEPNRIDFKNTQWAVEEKYDGHRLIVSVQSGVVRAWARSGKDRELPKHLHKALSRFPSGLYDGELCVPHGRSYNVTELEREKDRCYVVFDVLEIIGRDVTSESYDRRREALRLVFSAVGRGTTAVQLAESTNVSSLKEAQKLCSAIWKRDGEGIILKDRSAKYQCGDRPKTVVKMKNVQSAVLAVVNFSDGKWGKNSKVHLVDNDGNETSVKVRNLKVLRDVQANGHKYRGRLMRIEFQERTPGGGYRGPVRMDRWENE